MRKLLLLILLAPASLFAAEVYRWVDADGTVHYSDRPEEGAETVIIPDAQSFSAPSTAQTGSAASSDEATDEATEDLFKYRDFAIVSPTQEEVFWNIGGELNVMVRSSPRLKREHTVFLYLDGQEVEQLSRGRTQAMLRNVVRGAHTLTAEVKDASGNSAGQSEPVTFVVQQTSIQNQNNPNRPGGPG